MPTNLIVIGDKDKKRISSRLLDLQKDPIFHVTNGTYAYSHTLIVPTVLAGFEYISDTIAGQVDPFMIAVNSNVSMQHIMEKRIAQASAADKDKLRADMAAMEDETVRAEKVAIPLALQNPGRLVIVVFYDEETPVDLYAALKAEKVFLNTLFKYGYGTDPAAPKIEGAADFKAVLAFPLVKDPKPICHDITASEDQSHCVKVVKLHQDIPDNPNSPYLSDTGRIVFPVQCEELLQYSDSQKLKSSSRPKPF